jgi:hypothetical protein
MNVGKTLFAQVMGCVPRPGPIGLIVKSPFSEMNVPETVSVAYEKGNRLHSVAIRGLPAIRDGLVSLSA